MGEVPFSTLFRDFITNNVPGSGVYKPPKRDIRDTFNALVLKLTGANSGALIATLFVGGLQDLTPTENTMGWVVGDPAAGADGVYQYSGGVWGKRAELPYNFIHLNNADAGTANDIVVTTATAVPSPAYGSALLLNITQNNTGPVTVAINGGTPLPLVTNIGAAVAADYLVAGGAVICVNTGSELQMLTFGNADAVQAAAEVAQAAAEAAAASVQAHNFTSLSDAQTATSAPATSHINGHFYRKVAAEPVKNGKYQNSNSPPDWYELYSIGAQADAYGVVADPTANRAANSTALINAARDARVTEAPLILPSGGVIPLNSIEAIVREGPISIVGMGMHESILDFDDTDTFDFLRRYPGDDATYGANPYFHMFDCGLQGSWLTNQSASGATEEDRIFNMLIYGIPDVRIQRNLFRYLRDSAVELRDCEHVDVSDNKFFQICRAGINVGECKRITIANNDIRHAEDDAIAIANNGQVADPATTIGTINILGNRIEDATGINMLGIKHGIIANNLLSRCFFHGISLEYVEGLAGAVWEGDSSALNILIEGNVIHDMLDTDELNDLYNNSRAIRLKQTERSDDGDGRIPGRNTTSDGSFNSSYPGYYPGGDQGSIKQASSLGVTCRGNIVSRTHGTAGDPDYEDFGYGQKYERTGMGNPEVRELPADGTAGNTVALGNTTGIQILGPHEFLTVESNKVIGARYGIVGTNGVMMRNSTINDNIFARLEQGILLADIAGEQTSSLEIRNNLFDLDPEMESPNRTNETGWLADGNSVAISAVGMKGLRVIGNTFANCSNPVLVDADTYLHLNTIRCSPDVTSPIGFNTLNLGVGHIYFPQGDTWLYEIMDLDLDSATFGDVESSLTRNAAAKPSAGRWIPGWFVASTSLATPSGSTVLGWRRQSASNAAGTNHAQPADWVELSCDAA